jgi:DNA-binding GntR family transcriptional regulator
VEAAYASRSSAREMVYRSLRHDILHLILKPGTKMSEQEVSERFHVSRTPVREVFVRLFQDGLVEVYPQRGTYVSLINLANVDEGRFAREVLEMAVVQDACGHLTRDDIINLESNLAQQEICHDNQSYLQMLSLDDRFHAALFRICGRERTWQMISQLNNDFFRLRVLRLSHHHDWDRIIAQHRAILDAVKENKPDTAAQTMQEHLRMVIVERKRLLQEFPDYFAQP